METQFSGRAHVAYSQIYVESDPDEVNCDLRASFAGQSTGLCGAAEPGFLYLITGLHTGQVGFTVELHDAEPPLDPAWEEAVEVSFRPATPRTALVEWAGQAAHPLRLAETDYRVRYCATGMEAGRDQDTLLEDEPLADRYLLQFWPAPPRPDALLKRTSGIAGYWHGFARELPPPPTPEERAADLEAARRAEEAYAEKERLRMERERWGGRLPSARLRELRCNPQGLVRFDVALVHALDDASPDLQRAAARLAAHRACELAGLGTVGWIAAGLDALDAGRPLPAPLDHREAAWRRLHDDPDVPRHPVDEAVPVKRQVPGGSTDFAGSVTRTGRLRNGLSVMTGPPGEVPRSKTTGASGAAGATAPSAAAPRPPVDGSGEDGRIAPLSGENLSAVLSPQTGVLRPLRADPPTRLLSARTATVRGPREPRRLPRSYYALSSLLDAADPDPLRGAVTSVYSAIRTFGSDHPALLDEVRALADGTPGDSPRA